MHHATILTGAIWNASTTVAGTFISSLVLDVRSVWKSGGGQGVAWDVWVCGNKMLVKGTKTKACGKCVYASMLATISVRPGTR